MLAIVVAVFAFYPSNYYIYLPDRARVLEPVVHVEGEHDRPGDGGIYMVDVIIQGDDGSLDQLAAEVPRHGGAMRRRRRAGISG